MQKNKPETIKITSEAFNLMALFQKVTGAMARDCVIDNKVGRVIFLVNNGFENNFKIRESSLDLGSVDLDEY